MRPICCRFWQFNCWTFKVSFVVCTSSFVGSAWASSLVLDLRLWRASSLSCMLGSGLSRSPPLVLGSMFFICGLSFYLDVVDSHLLLSLAGLVHCNTAPALVKHSHKLWSCLPPLVMLGNHPLFTDYLETALRRVRQSMVLGETWQFTMPASPATS